MFTIKTKNETGSYLINLPTTLNEIPVEYLKNVTAGVKIAPNYSLIALCHREKLSAILLANRQKKSSIQTSVVPIFISCGKTDSDFIKALNMRDRIVVAPSQMAIAHHIAAPKNTLTVDNILNIIIDDKEIYNQSLFNKQPCYFLEFKLVPNCDIVAAYGNENAKVDDPFCCCN